MQLFRTGLFWFLLSALTLTACQGLGGEPQIVATVLPRSGTALEEQVIATTMMLGGDVWATNCAECHGRLGEGTAQGAPLPDLSEYSDERILASVTSGIDTRMPAFGELLNQEQLEAVSTYAKMISLARSRDMIQGESAPAIVATEEASGPTRADLEMTDDPQVIRIERMMAQIEVLDDTLYVLQIVQFLNTSNRVYFVSTSEGGHSSVSMPIPTGAQVQDMAGSSYQVAEDGSRIFDMQPVFPNEPHIMHLAYSLPYTQTTLTIDQTFDYDMVGSVDVLVATGGLSLTSHALTQRDTRVTNGIQVIRYSSQPLNLAPGDVISYTISGEPVPAAPPPAPAAATTNPPSADPLAYVMIGAGLSAVLIAGGLYIRERFIGGAAARQPKADNIADLTEQIATLDLQHQQGQIDAPTYQRRRAALKARLTALMETQRPRT